MGIQIPDQSNFTIGLKCQVDECLIFEWLPHIYNAAFGNGPKSVRNAQNIQNLVKTF